MKQLGVFHVALICIVLSGHALFAKDMTLWVSQSASPGGDGTSERPYCQIQAALDRVEPGTTIRVGKGIYNEQLVFKKSGTKENPIVLQGEIVAEGEQGAVVELAKAVKLRWEKALDWGEGVYRVKTGRIRVLYANGRDVPAVRYDRTHPNSAHKEYQTDPVWHHSALFRQGVRFDNGSGFKFIKALWMYHPEDEYTYLKFGDNANPNDMEIRIDSGDPVISVENASHVVIQDMHFRFACTGVYIDNCNNVTVRNCRIHPAEYGLTMIRCGRCRILNNEISRGATNSMDPFESVESDGNIRMDIWNLHKLVGNYDSHGVELANCTADNEVAYNYIHDQWDGIQCYFMGSQRLKVHHNSILRCTDDGLVFNAECPDQEWYSNTVVRAFASFRIYPAHMDYWGDDDLPESWTKPSGPVYIYRNVFIDGYQDNLRLWNDSLAHAYIYHNTVLGTYGLTYFGQVRVGCPNYHIFNNRFFGDYLAILAVQRGSTKVMPNFQADYNCYFTDKEGNTQKYGLEKHGTCGRDFVDKGADLSAFFGKSLPGCKHRYFSGKAPDCGAHEFGKDGQAKGQEVNTPLGVFTFDETSGRAKWLTVETPQNCGPRTMKGANSSSSGQGNGGKTNSIDALGEPFSQAYVATARSA